MHFTKLRLSGFKSFVDPTEFEIAPGLTGIVGPNGCGKSNLVEALRWVMGENRAKQMRGGEMDDVIFAGTTSRPQRDVAEVALLIDNSTRRAPPAFNELSEIEVVRRIERGQGSNYRISGREARQRDVQFFFADIASGAHSPALVSQGRIGAIINAKPTERRQLIEEAAGITGLHSRRHEAELKLKAAEANLARLDDVLNTLDQQFQGLKKQARQAARYRNLSDLVRRAEAGVLTWRWKETQEARSAAAERLAEAERRVAEVTEQAAHASTRLAESEAKLPDLRKAEAEAAAAIHRLAVAREQLDAEEARVRAAIAEMEARLVHLASDNAREQSQIDDAERALAALAAERAQIVEAQGSAAAERDELARRIEVDRADVESRDQAVAHATAAVAAAEAERAQLRRRADEAAQRIARLEGRLADLAGERERLEAEISRAATLELAAAQVAASERAFADARQRQDDIEGRRRAAQEEESGARKALAAAEADLSKLDAEASALSSVLAEGKVEGFRAVLEDLHVDPGYEAALAAALGDDLDAPIDGAAPRHWRADGAGDGTGPALPIGATALADHVRAPAALARRLAQIGVVDDEAGDALAPQLAQGQRLVSRAGALWRWDGFVVRAGTPAAAAARLKQKNRLAELTAQRAPIAAVVEGCRTRLVDSQAALRGAQVDEEQARDASRRMMNELNAARAAAAAEAQAAAARTARRDALIRQDGELTADLAEHRGQAEAVAARFAEIADPAEARAQLEADRRALHDARTVLMELQATMSRLAREGAQREDRLRAIGRDEHAWTQRGESARRQLAVLVERTTQTTAERERIAARPDEIVAERNGLFERIGAAEATRRDAADRLAEAEHETAEAGRALKAIEAELGGAREDRVRTEANRDQAERDGEELTLHIRERLDCAPEETLPLAQADSIDDLPPLAQLQARLERLVKERETVGPVNLRAEEEAEELSKQIEGMRNERDDLTRAIARLRQGISSLNREGRERLLAAFQTVNKHFSELFSKLFGGGRAHLALSAVAPADENGKVDDDPLEAGLEVMASPPGKKLQSLTLLSGGEQALTALALLFAVFQTNPAPICVLDEVDAPLDDANVDRFCTLLDAITRMTDTRFVVVTHHRMTMARMDRLFGVTMGERGVSQLVSVDLAQAARLRATA